MSKTDRALLKRIQDEIEIKDRVSHSKKFRMCFVASELVTWMVENKVAENREAAVTKANGLIKDGEDFEDDQELFFRFPKGTRTKQVTSLIIQIFEGKDLVAMDINGFSDPYLKIKVIDSKENETVKTTPVIKKNLNPFFDVKEIIPHKALKNLVSLKIEVWDHDLMTQDDFMGQCYWDIATLVQNGQQGWVKLYPKERTNSTDLGELRVHIRSQKHKPGKLFKIDLIRQQDEPWGLGFNGNSSWSSWIITMVIPGQQAYRNQLRIDDQIIAVNGKEIHSKNYKEILDLLCSATEDITLTIHRRELQFFEKATSRKCNDDSDFPIENPTLWYQKDVYDFYMSHKVQLFVAALIFFNYFVAIAEKSIRPTKGSDEEDVFYIFEIFFGVVFTIELVVNLYGSWFYYFWKSGWNWFDFIIVSISLIAMSVDNIPGISILRLFRAFRVFRLFKRIPSLRVIIEGIMASLQGVANAFVVLTILMGIWSIMGVEFFRSVSYEEFGTFLRAMFTMWQLMSMDSWASIIARNAIYKHSMPLSSIYFISFLFVTGIVMTNVIVAILLENYLTATASEEANRENAMNGEDDSDEEEEEEELAENGASGSTNENSEIAEANRDKLIGIISEVLTKDRLNQLEHSQLLQLFCSVYTTPEGRDEINETVKQYKVDPSRSSFSSAASTSRRFASPRFRNAAINVRV